MAPDNVTTPKLTHSQITNEVIDLLSEKTAKLEAFLVNAYGEAGESFRSMNDELQDTYIWACGDLAGEIKALIKRL